MQNGLNRSNALRPMHCHRLQCVATHSQKEAEKSTTKETSRFQVDISTTTVKNAAIALFIAVNATALSRLA